MNHTRNAVAVGIFHRQHIAAIPTGHYLIRQHLSLIFENLLQNFPHLVFIFLNFSADAAQTFAGKAFDKTAVIHSLQTSLQLRENSQILKQTVQLFQVHIFQVLIKGLELLSHSQDALESQKLLNIQVTLQLQALGQGSDILSRGQTKVRMLHKNLLHIRHFQKSRGHRLLLAGRQKQTQLQLPLLSQKIGSKKFFNLAKF